MTSAVDLCNLALQKLGAARITSLDTPDSVEAELCALHFPMARDAVLEEHTWSFASSRRVLNPTGNTPAWGDDTEFQVPQDVVMVARIYASTNVADLLPPDQWRRMGEVVYASTSTAYAVCVDRVTDLTRFPALVKMAVATRLAAELCMAITESPEREQQLWVEYATKVREAAAADGLQARREVVKARRLVGARYRV